jgi:hypothetical protein
VWCVAWRVAVINRHQVYRAVVLSSYVLVVPLLIQSDVHPRTKARGIRTYRRGDINYLESWSDTDTVRIGIHSKWGGSIVELTYRGRELVNHYDHGREVQLALYGGEQRYDSCSGCSGSFGWNPVQAGDRHGHDSPVVAESLGSDFVYTKTVPIEWFPDDKGGGIGRPVKTSVTMEQWVSIAPSNWRAFNVRYRIAYNGADKHVNCTQELPAVYVNKDFNHFVYYDGPSPWSYGSVSDTTLALPPPDRMLYTPERWLTLADKTGFGLTVFVPHQYPYGVGRFIPGNRAEDFPTAFYRPMVTHTWLPGLTIEDEFYLIPGHFHESREFVYAIRDSVRTSDVVTPFGFVDSPKNGELLSGRVPVAGWAIDNERVALVQISVDGRLVDTAEYGLPRHDIPKGPYQGSSASVGYRYWLDTRRLSNGTHILDVWVNDQLGNRALFGEIPVRVQN